MPCLLLLYKRKIPLPPARLQICMLERHIQVLTQFVAAHEEQQRAAAQQEAAVRQAGGRATWTQSGLRPGGQPGGQQGALPPLALPMVRWATKTLRGRPTVVMPHTFEYRVRC